MEKEKYPGVELEIIRFDCEDIITASVDLDDDETKLTPKYVSTPQYSYSYIPKDVE